MKMAFVMKSDIEGGAVKEVAAFNGFTLVELLWKKKLILLFVSSGIAFLSYIYSLTLADIYRAEVVVISASNNGGGAGALIGQFGGLASLAGINVGNGELDKGSLALEVIRSKAFTVDFLKKRNLIVPLMAAKSWDKNENKLILDSELYDEERGLWKKRETTSFKPTILDTLDYYFKHVISLSKNKKNGVVRIRISSLSPVLARDIANWLVEDINDYMRVNDIRDAEKSIQYLQEQLAVTDVHGMQQAFYELIEQQTSTMMLASVNEEYALKVLDPAIMPEKKSGPKRAMIVLVSFLLGFMLSALATIVKELRQ